MLTKRHRRLGIEGLERRTMMAADLVNGTLSIVGTNGNDNIEVQVAVGGAHAGELQVDVNGEQSFFTVAQVSSIEIAGRSGNDDITVDDNVLIDATINGGQGNDTIKGGAGNDTIHGNTGNDTIEGSLGNDTIFGDQGNDTIHADEGDDTVHGNSGNDRIWGGDGMDTLYGDSGNDNLDGEADDDTCYGNNGKDDIRGGTENDALFGGNGKDTLWGEAGDDYLDGGNGMDTCRGGLGDDELKGGNGKDLLDGDQGNNLLDRDRGKDTTANGIVADLDQELRALMSGQNNDSARAKYDLKNDDGSLKTEFEVEVHHLAANTTFDIIIDGVTVGQITTDGSGDGELEFSSDPSGGEAPFPAAFPTIEAGSLISIGNVLQGTFVKWHWM
jgi:Ca2+-binding RTX toxin-like protein